MPNLFLDKGVVLGFCHTVESHHQACREYLTAQDVEPYFTREVERIFSAKRNELSARYSNAVLEHMAEVNRGDRYAELGPSELQAIRRSIPASNPARDFLLRWYEGEVPQFIARMELVDRLRNMARDIDQMAVERKKKLDEMTTIWERDSDYPEIQSALSEIREDKEEDLWICIDAHDLAVRTEDRTELGTTDLNDLIRDGRRDLIVDETEIDDVISLADEDP